MNKATAAIIAGTTISLLTLQIPTAHAEADEILEIGDKCFVEKVVTEEKVIATETVAQPTEREGDWQIGEIEGPEGWTFGEVKEGETTVNARIPGDTPTGEYTVKAFHYGYNKNQITEFITFEVVEQDVTESRTWTEREEVPCASDVDGDETTNGNEDELTSEVLSDERTNFVDYKVLAQQQAATAPAPAAGTATAPVASTPAAEVTPAPAAQQVQLADNGTSGTLVAVAVGLLAAAGGALLMFRRRA
ncbi:MAG: hypothetical protein Q4G50_11925 [Corynebacterium sp.]|uniref:hypothetical protein n=1 Tax=Corynebacterium sp. TaxID=1720 RepID=UPI0026E0E767|nr:hypothetical protein [Corynebacterium sp.]MDO5670691.1 hypothetical protein [Corynebacterium sp.]